ncbi:PDGLE domain-containing protein [Saccharomonospora saliphila]|uniref:PDGLE domain-containing protein n=1 Tax=Saccharomonospora saliphila TaxID=369829 RepID=UPI00039B8C88|nr:PDGLE domain-containing protein [Saccharomonospora saliphila]
MSGPGGARPRARRFWVVSALVTLVLGGAVSYMADSDPDGLETVLRHGCAEVGDELRGECAARHAREHDLAASPFADYAVGGDSALTGVAGVLGVLITLAVTVLLVRVLTRAGRRRAP